MARDIEWGVGSFGIFEQSSLVLSILRFCEGINRAIAQGFAGVGDNQISIEINGASEAVASGTGSVGVIE